LCRRLWSKKSEAGLAQLDFDKLEETSSASSTASLTLMNPKKNKRWRLELLVGYLILLGASHVMRRNTPAETPLTNGKRLAHLSAIDGDQQTGRPIRLAYREFSLAGKNSLPVLLLLHGSPMGSESFDDLGPALGKSYRVIVPDVQRFVGEVESGQAPTRATAGHERIAAAQLPFVQKQSPFKSGIGLFVLMLSIAAATLVSEDLTCIGAGLMVARGAIDFTPATLACFLGIYFGDLLLFWAGRVFGRAAVRYVPLKWFISADDLERSTNWFNQRGAKIILLSRFLPGSRLPTYFAAGVLHTHFWSFSLFFLLASLLWTPLLVGLAMLVGEKAFALMTAYQKYAIVIVLAGLAAIYALFKIIIPLFNYKGRRLLLSSWRRLMRWEFWPLWFFYPPIILYILYLGLKHRSLTLFTAANPAIPESGFVGESKAAILEGLAGADGFVARHILIQKKTPVEARRQQAREFMRAHNLKFPIVIKPDKGQRGAGVSFVHTEQRLEEYLANIAFDVIVQEYVEGSEFGIFYVRYPNSETGFIYSITDKRLISVTGDGKRTLEKLILADDRAVCMARFHLQKHKSDLYKIPARGEEVKLVDIGTHCRGAMFLNGAFIHTPALEARLDAISKSFKGFYFGRYDIRTPSIADIKNGIGFKVVELNGVTSEAAHIYDPKNSLVYGYRVLMKQWRMAFEIGEQNLAAGVKPASVARLLSLLCKQDERQ
jgi:membrane protein DedA with SNARE-associated domain